MTKSTQNRACQTQFAGRFPDENTLEKLIYRERESISLPAMSESPKNFAIEHVPDTNTSEGFSALMSWIEKNPGLLEPGASFEVRQTHISHVFLSKNYVYKFKKPVNFGFIVQETLEQRKEHCFQEWALNNRLSTDVYLDVLGIFSENNNSLHTGRLSLEHYSKYGEYLFIDLEEKVVNDNDDSQISAVEHYVRMKRLNESDSFLERLKEKTLSVYAVQKLAGILAEFHFENFIPAEENPQSDFFQNFKDNLTVLDGFQYAEESVLKESHEILEKMSARVKSRHKRNCLVNGHGDLRLEHVFYYDDVIQIIDAIEFNSSLRLLDIWEDFGFLTMELKSNGHPEFARKLIQHYFHHFPDPGVVLVPLYEIYRAQVRLKILRILFDGEGGTDWGKYSESWENLSRVVADDLASYKEVKPSSSLTALCGLPLSGKSTQAEKLLREDDSVLIVSSDIVRKKILARERNIAEADLYSSETTKLVYRRMLSTADILLKFGYSVVLDATFSSKWQRDLLFRFAEKKNIRPKVISLKVSEETAAKRLEERLRNHSYSDVRDMETWRLVASKYEEPDEEEKARADWSIFPS